MTNLGLYEFYIVGDRPVKIVPTEGGGKDVLTFEPSSDKFVPGPEYLTRVTLLGEGVREVDQDVFDGQVAKLRTQLHPKLGK